MYLKGRIKKHQLVRHLNFINKALNNDPFRLIPLISVFRRVAYVIDLGVDGWTGVQNWMGGIEIGWVDKGGQIHARADRWL